MDNTSDFEPVIIKLIQEAFPDETFEKQKEIQTHFAEYVLVNLILDLDSKSSNELLSQHKPSSPEIIRIFIEAFPDIEDRIRELLVQFIQGHGNN